MTDFTVYFTCPLTGCGWHMQESSRIFRRAGCARPAEEAASMLRDEYRRHWLKVHAAPPEPITSYEPAVDA